MPRSVEKRFWIYSLQPWVSWKEHMIHLERTRTVSALVAQWPCLPLLGARPGLTLIACDRVELDLQFL